MQKNATKQPPKRWEQPYKKGNLKEDTNQYEIFQIYNELGPTRSIPKLWEYQFTWKKMAYHPEAEYPKNISTLYRWANKYEYDERISEKISHISSKVTEQTIELNLQSHRNDMEHRLKADEQTFQIDKILDDLLQKIKEGNTELFKFLQLSVDVKVKIKTSGINTTTEANELNNIINNLNKSLHPENKRDGLKTLAESIRESLEKLDEK